MDIFIFPPPVVPSLEIGLESWIEIAMEGWVDQLDGATN